jgi:hypothetical protein
VWFIRLQCSAQVLRTAGFQFGGATNGGANAVVGATPADVSSHGVIDLLVGRVWRLCEQRRCRHDLARLTIPALRNVDFDPSYLHGMIVVSRKTLDGRHFLTGNGRYRCDAGTRSLSVDVNRTGSAQCHAAPELRAGHVEMITNDPKQRHVRIHVHRLRLSVQDKMCRH